MQMKMRMVLDDWAVPPTRAHSTDAGLDLRTPITIIVPPASLMDNNGCMAGCVSIQTGVHIAIPQGYFGKVESRSGLNINHGIVCCGGVVDSGYTGGIMVKLYNTTAEPYKIAAGDKIAQLIIQPCEYPQFELVERLDETERGDSGFGSTGR